MWCILALFHPVEDHKNRVSKNVIHEPTLCVEGLEFSRKGKDGPKFERLNKLNINVLELIGTPIHKNTNYDQPQVNLLLYENNYCLIT